MAFLAHRTTDADRWDLLAWRYYGDPYGYERIIAANPGAPITPVLPAGLTLYIPVLTAAEAAEAEAPAELPPWLR